MAKILIIDDESNIRMMLRLALEHVGHTVTQASDGYEGLEKFGTGMDVNQETKSDWELVLLDHRMPGMEGIDVLKELRQRSTMVPVIMITAFGTIDLATEALKSGATDFLRKPFTVDVLRESVEAALLGKPHLPHAANAVSSSLLSFEKVGINGFRLETLPGLEKTTDGTIEKIFSVQRTQGAGRACHVVLAAKLVEQVNAHLQSDALLKNTTFWESLCSEALANYLWQNASLPSNGRIIVDELTRGLERWVETVKNSSLNSSLVA